MVSGVGCVFGWKDVDIEIMESVSSNSGDNESINKDAAERERSMGSGEGGNEP